MEQTKQEMILGLEKMVGMLTRRYINLTGYNGDRLDVFQAGMVAVVECAERYDSTRGAKFSTFAYHAIRKAVMCAVYRTPESGYGDDFSVMIEKWGCGSPTQLDQILKFESERILHREIENLTGNEGVVLYLRHIDGMAVSDIATALNMSRQAVHKTATLAHATLRRKLA